MTSPPAPFRLNLTVLILIGAIIAALGFWLGNRYFNAPTQPQLGSALLYSSARALPEFQLNQPDGKPLTLADWRGHWNLVYFGYTHCPDVCPTTLQTLKSAWIELGKRGVQDKIRVDFVSVDPERDTPEALAKYAGFFSPDFIAATGSDEELLRITRALGLIYTRSKNADGSVEVDHSDSIVIVDPQARLVGLFRPPHMPKAIADDITALARNSR